ncbi:RING-H2 finger protein ATL70-like [Vigna unguiculata]|uniref:RING-H2 finger protein ATL70-like n=1 Tax=Vigna unguiculata TaxID=3917 RepID=UPI001016F35B|nr:RING-H2 finger protein ATL70-like [Vigna unguiculata]
MNSSEESVLLLVSFIILTLIVTLAAYLCSTDIPRTAPSVPAAVTHSNHTTITVEAPEPCIDQSVCNFPSLQFSKAKLCGSTSSSSSSCSICLMDYKDRDSLRVLPACGHFFHVKCVDPWLRINMTCPVCRTTIALSDKCQCLSIVLVISGKLAMENNHEIESCLLRYISETKKLAMLPMKESKLKILKSKQEN